MVPSLMVCGLAGFKTDTGSCHHAEPQVMRKDEIPAMKWGSPDEAGLVTFLVTEKGFNEDRVRKVAERIRGSKGKSNQGAARH